MASRAASVFLGRGLDRRITRPQGLVYGLDEAPAPAATIGLALQQVAIQSIYFVIPAVLAGSLSPDPTDASRFLSLSILAVALWQALQVLTRGVIGSGYPIPGTHTAALVGAYSITGLAGLSFGAAGAMLMLTGLTCVILTFVVHRLRLVLPGEVAGVVVILIGVALIGLATHRFGLQAGGKRPESSAVLVFLASIIVMAVVALSRTRASPFAVLFGMIVGVPLALALGHGYPDAAARIADRPWIAMPEPWLPRFDQISPVPLLAFLVAIVALKATAMGSMVVMQRASDAGWTRADAPPIRRGLLANALSMIVAGAMGAACPAPATAVAVAPAAFVASIPVLASPLSIGALVAFLMNLFTLPMVSRRSELVVPLDAEALTKVEKWIRELAGSWALKAQTEIAAEQSLFELTDLLIERGIPSVTFGARLAEDRIEITLTWAGAPLPDRPKAAKTSDLMVDDDEVRHGFSVWLATRQAQGFRQRQAAGGNEVWLAFED